MTMTSESFAELLREYEETSESFVNGIISEREWLLYCEDTLDILMENHNDILERLSKT